MKKIKLLKAFLIFLFSFNLWAGDVYIPVGEAKIKKSLLAFPDTKIIADKKTASSDPKNYARTVKDFITHDLDFTYLFTFQSPNAFIEKDDAGITMDSFKMSDWETIGTEFLIKTSVSVSGDTANYELRLYNITGKKHIFGKKYVAKVSEPKALAHTVANDIVEALTGKKGIFFSRITMVCDKGGSKEIWVTNFDGSNPQQITRHKSLAFAPAWSPDNKKIAYSVYTRNFKNVKNIDLYEYDFESKKSRLLSNQPGINSGASYSPNGRDIALTMSFLGNPDIFLLNSQTLQATRLTKSLGVDVDPDFSPDGRKLAFVSSRAGGQPHVYISNADGSNPVRVTFAGVYNATPRWNPAGNRLVFAGDLGRHFDIFLINSDQTNLERLTKDEGNNEDPDFSPDGNFIVFNSNRSNQKNIYVMTVDGLNTRRITYGLGNCVAPKWSNYEKQ